MGHASTLEVTQISDKPWYVYSHEAMPRTDLFEKRDYNADTDWIAFNGIHIGAVPEKTWYQIPRVTASKYHQHRADTKGTTYHVFAEEIVKANAERMRPRGVIFLDHVPTEIEKAELAIEAEKRNLEFRLQCIQQYEEANKEAAANGRTAKATSYVRECYKILNMELPGSVEALRAQRQPGESAADRISIAIETAFERLLAKMAAQQTAPKEPVRVIK